MNLCVEVIGSLDNIRASDWNRWAGTANPFVSHQFLRALESSGTADAGTGWKPHHLLLKERPGGPPLGVAPLYLKTHSMGEYIFDYGWANAYSQMGRSYYPKLQSAVPYTPVPGPRFLGRNPAALGQAVKQLVDDYGISGGHVTFCSREEGQELAQHGYLLRTGQQYHWFNRDYQTFDDFLSTLSSRKRKAIRRERRKAHSHGLNIEVLKGAEIQEHHLDHLYDFYIFTARHKWGKPYLNRKFFSLLHESMPEALVLVMARHGGDYVAAAWNLRSHEAIFGRNWGCRGFFDCLHFEVCYYQAIEFAIRHRLARVEAGAQGLHKIQRGYLPVPVYSVHYLADPVFRRLIADYLVEERQAVQQEIELLKEHSPYS